MPRFLPIEARLQKMGFGLIAGLDEVGRGPLAGPVVSAAVILKNGAVLRGVTDSKKLSASMREKLFKLIVKNSVDYTISFVPHSTIDKINILNAVREANRLCIKNLKNKPDFVLIDGRDSQILDVPFQTIIKGDARVKSIAAASILAKVARDRLMKYYSKEFGAYGFERNVGYGTREHRGKIEEFGYCEIHRRSFVFKKVGKP